MGDMAKISCLIRIGIERYIKYNYLYNLYT